jgi:hypothetical protein
MMQNLKIKERFYKNRPWNLYPDLGTLWLPDFADLTFRLLHPQDN